MKLFKLSIKNIKKSFKDYAIYFFTLILGVSIFYLFNSIDSQTAMMNITESTREIIDLMINMLSGVSVFVSFVLGFLIIYASRFLMKRRHKEFGIYMTLGMGKGQISKILLFETILIGCVSLVVGSCIGILLSQLMSVFVANMFEVDMTEFTFVFSSSALIKTIIYFGIMYVLVMIFNTIQVGKCKLIDLLYANKKSEKVHMKNPWVCTIVFILGAGLLGYAYYLVTAGVNQIQNPSDIFPPIIMGVVSTFLIIWSLSGLILKIVMSMKGLYYKGLNSFTLRQISSKINTTVFSMGMICLMLFITICVLSSSLSLKNSLTKNLKELAPVDIELSKTVDMPDSYMEDYGYTKEEIDASHYTVMETLERIGFDSDKKLKDVVDIYTYANSELTVRTLLGSAYDQVYQTYPHLYYDSAEEFIKISDYNKVARSYGHETYELEDDEYMIVADFDSWISIHNMALKKDVAIEVGGKTLTPKYSECKDGFIRISSNHINAGIFVVPDNIDFTGFDKKNFVIGNYNAADKEGKQQIENELTSEENYQTLSNQHLNLSASSKISIYEASVGLGALVTFIGLYLGIIFLMSSAAILALKELSESTDNKERFLMLRKLGVDEKMINRALFRQIAIFFLFPLLLAIIHSYFGIQFANYLLAGMGIDGLLESIIMTAIFLICIYGGYFLITYFCSKSIISHKE